MLVDPMRALTDRVSALERRDRRQRLALVVVPLIALALGAAGADVADWRGKAITAERVTIVDAAGKPRVVLSGEEEVGIVILDADGAERISLVDAAKDGSPRLLIAGDNPRLGIGDGKGNVLFSAGRSERNGIPYVELLDGKGKTIVGWGGNYTEP